MLAKGMLFLMCCVTLNTVPSYGWPGEFAGMGTVYQVSEMK